MQLPDRDDWDDEEGGAARGAGNGGSRPDQRAPPLVLAFSLAATSTAAALFRGFEPIRCEAVAHPARDGAKLEALRDHRLRALRAFLTASGIAPGALRAIAVHADAPRPVSIGTYQIDGAILREAERQGRSSPASLAAVVAHALAEEWGCPALAVDPASSGEGVTAERAGSGVAGRDLLAMKAAARRHALAVDRPLEALRLVLVHLGSAVSLCVQSNGRLGDVQHALEQVAGPVDLEAVLRRAEAGDGRASAVLHGAANEIAKVVGGLATVLEGEVDAVLVTGALESAGLVVAEICRRVEWIAPVFLYRDQDELRALAQGAGAVLEGAEPLKRA